MVRGPQNHGASRGVATFLGGMMGIGLLLCSRHQADTVRAVFRDALRPALVFVRQLDGIEPSSRTDGVESVEWEHRFHRAMAAWMQARRATQRIARGDDGDPLLVPELVSAAVVGAESRGTLEAGKLIDFGMARGIAEGDHVTLIDQGDDEGLSPGLPAYAGQNVVGKVSNVGQLVSTVLPITSTEFSARAQLVRVTEDAATWGAEGLIVGLGDGTCALDLISATASVRLGDHVYTNDGDGLFPFPMYYGEVVRAEVAEGGQHWTIVVQPKVKLAGLRTLHVLRKSTNPDRVRDRKMED